MPRHRYNPHGGAVTASPVDALTGDDGTWEELLDAIAPVVYRRLLGMGASHADAEDVTQDALIAVWGKRDVLPASLEVARSYAFVCSRNIYVDLRRRTYKVVPMPDEAIRDRVIDPNPGPPELAEQAALRGALAAALLTLPPRDRALLVDTDIHGMDGEELNERYDSTANALKQRRWRSRRRLWIEMESWSPNPAPLACPLLMLRRLTHPFRHLIRRWNDIVVALGIPTAAVIAAVLTVVIGSWPPHAHRTPSPTLAAPGDTAYNAPVAARDTERDQRDPSARTSRVPRTAGPGVDTTQRHLPSICVQLAGPLGSGEDDETDVLVLRLPEPVGELTIRQRLIAVCWAPDVPVADCHTDGDPEYGIPPPRPPAPFAPTSGSTATAPVRKTRRNKSSSPSSPATDRLRVS
jgi:RNA polymerase sigma-70 factor (ECF subfamily)